ncbi:low-specificity L-threonine aldolase [Ruegeria sp. Ofav3-42]|uniref:low-specificity L-threonine aldolase n=1 Tax=Ruegeria sp. Ofav3-42 TaxID=2917759 RepID=UPI001EF623FC|nr:low-specificity L-threonine aldolase [Ruegeria sp. Ofav3-42]MCG7521502.1 low-specificity L-threonine aldolase [Ruegeria sp. Ofav3-42]
MKQKLELDFRSDTVTKPCLRMRDAMAKAEVGDDYYHDDPTVQELECFAADLFGKEAALLTPSGTQSNLIAVMSHCQRGEAYIVGHLSHSYLRELGGAAMIAGVQPQVVQNQGDGTLKLEDIKASLFPASILFAPVRLIAVENTIDGKVLPLDYLRSVLQLAAEHDLRIHMDGARIFNAAATLGCLVSKIASYCDTLSFCLSKGLGAPIGSVLVGSAEVIEKARRHRQMLGGGMRQAGIIAAAGLYAMQNNVSRLKSDHARAAELAAALSRVPGLTVEAPQTNMLFCDVDASVQSKFSGFLKETGIRISGNSKRQRWVTHLGIDDTALASTVKLLAQMQDVCDAS